MLGEHQITPKGKKLQDISMGRFNIGEKWLLVTIFQSSNKGKTNEISTKKVVKQKQTDNCQTGLVFGSVNLTPPPWWHLGFCFLKWAVRYEKDVSL